eukprot:s2706_g15.t4
MCSISMWHQLHRSIRLSRCCRAAMAPIEAAAEGELEKLVDEDASCIAMKPVALRQDESISSKFLGHLDVGRRCKVLRTSAPKTGERRRALVTEDSGRQGWITIIDSRGEPCVAPASAVPKLSLLSQVAVGSQLEVLCMLIVRAGEALSSPFLDTLLPHSRIKVLELAPESASQQRRALVSTVSVEPNEEHIQGWAATLGLAWLQRTSILARGPGQPLQLQRGPFSQASCRRHQAPKGDEGFRPRGKEESADANTRVQMVTKLLELARSGDLEAFKAIAEAGVLEPGTDRSALSPVSPTRHTKTLINRSDIRGRTALMYASAIGSRDIVDYLLGKGEVYVNAVDDTQKTALHHAVKSSKAEISRLLLRAGAMIDARDHNGCTALMLAAGTGDVDGVQVLLEKGANANARDYLGNSALSYAQDFNHQEVMDKLIQAGAEDEEEEEDSVVKSRKKRVRAETVNQEDLEKAAALAVLDDDDGLSEEDQRRAGAHERLKEVLEGTALTRDLEAALEEATQAQVEDESLLSTARSRLQDLKDRDDASDHLMAAVEEARQGCRGPENLQTLQEALEKAKAKGVAEKELQHGEQVLAEEMPRAQARQQLRDAQAKGSSHRFGKGGPAPCRRAPTFRGAPECFREANKYSNTHELLSGAESKEAAAAALKKATDARDVAALTFALQQAKEAGVDPELLATSEAVLAVEAPKQEAREALATQLAKVHAAGDKGPSLEELTVLESAIERARTVELPEAEFAQALDILAQEQQRAMCKKEVANVVEKLKDVDRNSMEALEAAKEELFNALLAAKAVEVPSAALREADGLRRRIHNALEDLKGSIRVFCRIRPINKREKELQDVDVTELVDSMTVNTQKPSYGSIANDPEQFNFDAVFKPGTQAEVFDTCKDLVQSALDGYNVAMFAYGQTGAGKTFTMYGSGTGAGENAGTAPRTIAELYRLIKQDEDRVQFTVPPRKPCRAASLTSLIAGPLCRKNWLHRRRRRASKGRHVETTAAGPDWPWGRTSGLPSFSAWPRSRPDLEGGALSRAKQIAGYGSRWLGVADSGREDCRRQRPPFPQGDTVLAYVVLTTPVATMSRCSALLVPGPKEGRSDEPWMHAADVPGSHVVVRQPGADKLPAPSDIVRTAAGIAAFYSKAKGRRVKVHLTRCGQVSKAKGSPAGKVLLTGSVETLQVPPLDPASLQPQKPQTKAKSARAKRTLLDPDKEAARLESLRAFRRKMNLERRIDVLDERIRAVDEEMALAGSDAELAAELLEKRQALETEQNTLFQDWEELEDASAGAKHGKRPLLGLIVMASMMELYRNELVDLLVPKSTGTSPKRRSQNPGSAALEQKLNVRVDKSGAVQIEHLREEECKTAEALSDLLERGNQMRTVCATKMNSESSRSHLILIIRVVGVNKQTEQKLSGKILLCDLAGSERLKKSDVSGDAQKEAIEINKSLTALGDVMESLVKGAAHVPYKNHKLTQVMSDALGGTSKTLMFVNCSPASSNYEETVMTLKFATRAKTITNDVKRKMVAKAKPMPKA